MEEKEEIVSKLQAFDKREDEINMVEREFLKNEEYEDAELLNTLSGFERIEDRCHETDREIQELIEEGKGILGQIRKERSDFTDEFTAKNANEKDEIDIKREELLYQLRESKEEK